MALLGRVSPRLCTSYNQHAASLRAAQLVSPVRCAGRRVACASASGAVTPVKAAPLEACDSSAQPTSSDGNSSASSEASELGQVSGQAAERADRTAEATSSGSSSSSDSEQAPWGASADGLTRAERRKAARVFPTLVPPGGLDDLGVLQNAVLLVDKPLTWTSFDVCGKIRNTLKFLGIRKVGHAGTLDPLASGLLLVCVGKATKFSDDFMATDKRYSGTVRLGQATASYDAESEVVEEAAWEHITDADIQAAASSFMGDIMQVPPMFSAIKVGGQKLYRLAREGTSLELQPRPVTVHRLHLWRDAANPRDVHFDVACSKGTYIRSLAHDLGRALGSCAHLVALRREEVGDFSVRDAWDLKQLIQVLSDKREQHRQKQEQEQREREDKGAEVQAEVQTAAVVEQGEGEERRGERPGAGGEEGQ